MVNGCLAHDRHLVSNEFNDYFISIGTKLADEKIPLLILYVSYILTSVKNSIYVPLISDNEVRIVIGTVKNSSAG